MSYHHGNLAPALVAAGFTLARQGGTASVTVRAAARRVGVSAPAAYRHFEDRDAFVAQVARCCRQELARTMTTARDRHRSPKRRFRATGRAYIEFAFDEPGLLECAFTPHQAHTWNAIAGATEECAADDPDAARVLIDVLDELHAAGVISTAQRPGAELVAWASVHGLAMLLAGTDRVAAAPAIERVLDGVEAALFG